MKHIIFVGMKKASKRNLHLLKRDMTMNESYHISSVRSVREFTDKLPFLWHLLNCKPAKRGRKLLARCLYFNTWTLCFYKERSVFGHVSASCLWNVSCLNLAFDPRRKKWYLRLYLTQIIHSNGRMLFVWRKKKILSNFLWCTAHVELFFTSRKSSVSHVSASVLRDVYCLSLKRFEDLIEKVISPVIFDTNRSFKL